MLSTNEQINTGVSEDELGFLKIQYQVLSERRINNNTIWWNAPSLLFVAQAFLWNTALDDTQNWGIRCLISLFSLVIAYTSY